MSNRWREDTLGPRGIPMNQIQSIDSLFNPDACKSVFDRPEDSQYVSTAKIITAAGARNSLRETTRNTSEGSSICEADEKHFNKRYRDSHHEKGRLTAKTRQPSPCFAVSNQNSSKEGKHANNYKLQNKIHDLRNLIESEEKIISSLHKKVSNEKSTLDYLEHQLEDQHQKIKAQKKKLKQRGFNKSSSVVIRPEEDDEEDDLEAELGLGKTIHARSKARLIKMLGEISGAALNDENSRSIRLSAKKLAKHAQSTKASCSQFETLDRDAFKSHNPHRDHSSNKKKERSILKETNYNDEITTLRRYLQDLRKENLELKQSSVRVKENDLLQVEQTKKMQHLIEVLAYKEKELVNHEKYYREKIEDMGMKIMELNDQMEMALRYQDTIKSLAQEVKLKEVEIELTKKFFVDKLQGGFQSQPKKKHEWAHAHDALMKELGMLRGKLDSSFSSFPNK